MKGRDFVFDSIDEENYKYHRISLKCGGSYKDPPDCIKNIKATKNSKNNDDKCFQYVVTVAIVHERFVKYLQGRSKIKPFIKYYNRKEISLQSQVKGWRKFEFSISQLLLMFCLLKVTKKK